MAVMLLLLRKKTIGHWCSMLIRSLRVACMERRSRRMTLPTAKTATYCLTIFRRCPGRWSAFGITRQHRTISTIASRWKKTSTKSLPQLSAAARNGDLPPAMIAALKDRIDVREGRPQKYGTQIGPDGLCPLLDASRVNEWRKEVGLPPMEIK